MSRIHYVYSEKHTAWTSLLPQSTSSRQYPAERENLVHALVSACGLLRDCTVVAPKYATSADLCAFHDPEYIEAITKADPFHYFATAVSCPSGKRRRTLSDMPQKEVSFDFDSDDNDSGAPLPPPKLASCRPAPSTHPTSSPDDNVGWDPGTPPTEDDSSHSHEVEPELSGFGLCDDCPAFPGLFGYCAASAGGVLTAAASLHSGEAEIAVAWSGSGRHHAKKGHAAGFCFVNDCVLGILALQKGGLKRILYVDIDIHHGDGVEEAFASSDRVWTLSFHKHAPGFFPGTGGPNPPRMGIVNVPLCEPMDDQRFLSVFRSSLEAALHSLRPDAIVLQCGVDGCAGDPVGDWNLTSRGFAACAAMVRNYLPRFGCKLLVLGGGGYNPFNVARCWTAVTAALTGASLPATIPDDLVADFVPSGHIQTHTQPPLAVPSVEPRVKNSPSRPVAALKTSSRYYCGSALQLGERDGEHIGSHLWRGAELLAKWIEQHYERDALRGTTVSPQEPNPLLDNPCRNQIKPW